MRWSQELRKKRAQEGEQGGGGMSLWSSERETRGSQPHGCLDKSFQGEMKECMCPWQTVLVGLRNSFWNGGRSGPSRKNEGERGGKMERGEVGGAGLQGLCRNADSSESAP